MALTEIQMISKQDLYSILKNTASNLSNQMAQYRELSLSLARLDASDIAAMGITDANVITDLAELRTSLSELVGFYYGTSTTRTNIPANSVGKIRVFR